MNSGLVGFALFICCLLLFAFVIWYFEFRQTDEQKSARKNLEEIKYSGIHTFAVVKKIDHMISGGSGGAISTYVEMTIEVELPDGKRYDVSKDASGYRGMFSFDIAYSSYVKKIGARIPVIVHPTEHQLLIIDEIGLEKMVIGQ